MLGSLCFLNHMGWGVATCQLRTFPDAGQLVLLFRRQAYRSGRQQRPAGQSHLVPVAAANMGRSSGGGCWADYPIMVPYDLSIKKMRPAVLITSLPLRIF